MERKSLRRWKDKEGKEGEVETGEGEREGWNKSEKSGQEREREKKDAERKKWLCLLRVACGESKRERGRAHGLHRRASSCQHLCVYVCVCLHTCKRTVHI